MELSIFESVFFLTFKVIFKEIYKIHIKSNFQKILFDGNGVTYKIAFSLSKNRSENLTIRQGI
jgi:hypothetical protein